MQKEAYIKLLDQHRDRIYSLALYSLRDADDAADITQETFLRLWRHEEEFSGGQAKAWLVRVCHNLCIDLSRRRKTVRTHFGVQDTEAVANLRSSPGSGQDPELELMRRQQQDHLLASMAVLPAETRSLMVMHYFQGLKIQEIAELSGLKISTIKVRLYRARKTLKNNLTLKSWKPLSQRQELG